MIPVITRGLQGFALVGEALPAFARADRPLVVMQGDQVLEVYRVAMVPQAGISWMLELGQSPRWLPGFNGFGPYAEAEESDAASEAEGGRDTPVDTPAASA